MKPWVPQKYLDMKPVKIQESMQVFGHPAFSTMSLVENMSFSFNCTRFFVKLDDWIEFVPKEHKVKAKKLVKLTEKTLSAFWVCDKDKDLFANVLLNSMYDRRASGKDAL